jgi:hypothetical protein
MTPELAAKIEASRCKLTDGQPVHLSREMVVDLLETKARVSDTLKWLRQYLEADASLECKVRAREVWNRLSERYFDREVLDPDEEVQI